MPKIQSIAFPAPHKTDKRSRFSDEGTSDLPKKTEMRDVPLAIHTGPVLRMTKPTRGQFFTAGSRKNAVSQYHCQTCGTFFKLAILAPVVGYCPICGDDQIESIGKSFEESLNKTSVEFGLRLAVRELAEIGQCPAAQECVVDIEDCVGCMYQHYETLGRISAEESADRMKRPFSRH